MDNKEKHVWICTSDEGMRKNIMNEYEGQLVWFATEGLASQNTVVPLDIQAGRLSCCPPRQGGPECRGATLLFFSVFGAVHGGRLFFV